MTSLRRALAPAIVTLLAAAVLAGCAPAAPDDAAPDGGSDGAADGGGEVAAAGPNCDNMTTAGWELFVDPRLTVEPTADIVPLTTAGESVAFTDTAPVGYTTYSYELGYIDESGAVFPNDSAIFVGAEDTGTFQLDGPFAPSGVDGGPYAGVVQIDATDDGGTTTLGRICVLLATED